MWLFHMGSCFIEVTILAGLTVYELCKIDFSQNLRECIMDGHILNVQLFCLLPTSTFSSLDVCIY